MSDDTHQGKINAYLLTQVYLIAIEETVTLNALNLLHRLLLIRETTARSPLPDKLRQSARNGDMNDRTHWEWQGKADSPENPDAFFLFALINASVCSSLIMGIVIREVQASGDSKSDSELLENVVSGIAATAVSLCLSWTSLDLAWP